MTPHDVMRFFQEFPQLMQDRATEQQLTRQALDTLVIEQRATRQALADLVVEQRGTRQAIEALVLPQPPGDIATRYILELTTPTVGAGSDHDFQGEFLSADGTPISFRWLRILQVEVDSPELADSDTVTLSLYRHSSRQTPFELIARYDGDSDVTGTWKSIFPEQNFEYFDREGESRLYGRVTNAAGNSRAATFHITVVAERTMT